MAAGAAVTWLAAWAYYKRAGDELTAETARLRRKIDDVLIGLERAGLVTRKVGPDGETMIDIQGNADITLPSLNSAPVAPNRDQDEQRVGR
jgi:hypothetical protein